MKRTIYNYVSEWGNGVEFISEITVKAFGSKEEAQAQLKADYEKAQESFNKVGYDKEKINTEIDEDGLRIMIGANSFEDYWQGKIQVEEITFDDEK